VSEKKEETVDERIWRKYYSDLVFPYTDDGRRNPHYQGEEV
jgi:hypothetical protein